VTPRLVRGTPEHVLENETRTLGAQCVVIGTVARTGLGGVIIGNTAENIINSLTHPLVAVKPDGFVTPLKLT
jgi:nucleotide-binding universal stress UspA family protein